MGMTREELKILVKGMKAVYSQPTFIPDQDAFNVWYELLKDIPYSRANVAIQKYMTSEKFPPTIADIRTNATEIIAPAEESMSELQAWDLVRRAIRNSTYYAESEFDKLPEACKIAVGSPGNLREWAAMETDQVATVEQSHFIRNYRAAVQRMKEDAKLPESVKTSITDMGKQYAQLTEKAEATQIATEEADASEKESEICMSGEIRKRLDELYKTLNGKMQEETKK